jgi:hypothetical protein
MLLSKQQQQQARIDFDYYFKVKEGKCRAVSIGL